MSGNTQDILVILSPAIIGFFLGYFAKVVDNWKESRLKKKNLKLILFKELKENYIWLNGITAREEDQTADDMSDDLMELGVAKLSTATFDAYLDRIDTLPATEVDHIWDAYYYTTIAIKEVNRITSHVPTKDEHKFMVGHILLAFVKVKKALSCFQGGKDFVSSHDSKSGLVIDMSKKS